MSEQRDRDDCEHGPSARECDCNAIELQAEIERLRLERDALAATLRGIRRALACMGEDQDRLIARIDTAIRLNGCDPGPFPEEGAT